MGLNKETFGSLCRKHGKRFNMENLNNETVVENTDTTVDETVTDTETTTEEVVTETETDGADEPVTFTEEEVAKKIQSAEDRLRRKYSDEIKELKAKISELEPVELSDEQKEIERLKAELEKSQAEANAQKQFIDLQNSLKAKGIDEKIATYLKDGVDLEEFATTFDSILSEKAKVKGFVPTDHPTGDNITVEQFKAMSYSQRTELYTKNPTLYEKLVKKAK